MIETAGNLDRITSVNGKVNGADIIAPFFTRAKFDRVEGAHLPQFKGDGFFGSIDDGHISHLNINIAVFCVLGGVKEESGVFGGVAPIMVFYRDINSEFTETGFM